MESTAVARMYGKNRKWLMLILVMLVYIIILGFTNQSFNVLLATIVGDMGWDAAQKTAVSGAMSLGMVWFCFVAGTAIDKIGVKQIMGICLAVLGILILCRGYAKGFGIWYAMMFIYGVVAAFYQPCVTKVVSLWFGKEDLAFANGCTTAASPIGQIIANLFAGTIVARLAGGWRQLYMIIGIVVFVLMVIWWIFSKNRKSLDAELQSETVKTKEQTTFLRNIGGVMRDPYVWFMIIADMCFLGAIYAGGTYGQYVLQMDPKWMIDKTISGRAPLMNNIFSTLSYLLLPLIVRKVGNKKYKWVVLVTGIVCPLLFVFGYRSYDFVMLCVMMAIAGALYGGAVPGPKVLMLQRNSVAGVRAGTAFGLMMTVERIGITVFITLLGGIIFTNTELMGITMSNFYFIQLIAPACVLIAILFARAQLKRKKS